MISNPLSVQRMVFVDWDDTWLGVLLIPKDRQWQQRLFDTAGCKDLRGVVNWFVQVNMVYPDLRLGAADPWAEAREQLKAQAERDWPRRRVYPEEAFVPVMENGTLALRHRLRYLPHEYLKGQGCRKTFRPVPEQEGKGALGDGGGA